MTDIYAPPGGFADLSAFVADANAINAATKTALNLALNNIGGLFGSFTPGTAGSIVDTVTPAAHPDFNKIPPHIRFLIKNEIATLVAAVTAHA